MPVFYRFALPYAWLWYVLLALFVVSCASGVNVHLRPEHSCLSRFESSTFDTVQNQDGGRICVLRGRSSIVESVRRSSVTVYGQGSAVLTGLDVVAAAKFSLLKKQRFALLTNATGRDMDLNPILDLLIASGARPDLILEPEHGLYGADDSLYLDLYRYDPETGIKILSLYSRIKRPGAQGLKGIDVLVVDLQNLPVRCYTYASTLTYLLEDAEKAGTEVLILDRPHPYGMWPAMGSMLETGFESFVGTAPVPFLYSMSVGEYAIYMARHRFLNLKLRVVQAEGFKPGKVDWVLAQSWINPSPNIPDLESALVYAGLVFFEGTNISLGRGTTRPFVYSGAPWLKDKQVLDELRKLNLKGVRFATVTFTPSTSLYANRHVKGIQFHPYSKDFDPLRTGFEYMKIIRKLHPDQFRFIGYGSYFIDKLWGSALYRSAVEADLSYEQFKSMWTEDAASFEKMTKSSRIYKD